MKERIDTQNTCAELDLGRNPRTALRVWGPPIGLIVIGTVIANVTGWPIKVAGLIWSGSILWLGLSCLRNARRCGRFHCVVLSILYPVFALLALGITFGLVQVQWNPFWAVFGLITIIAFIPEFFGLKYIRLYRT